MQLDNRLAPVLPIPSKLERLAIECMRPEMQLPCQKGQKWYCENDGGRWRRHKCKSIVHSTIPFPSERTYRKCACFTPQGLVYKKFSVSISSRDLINMLILHFFLDSKYDKKGYERKENSKACRYK